ncbi:uncharacterized protein LOC132739093 [Ruditapes philippinarum]|uniref:uncharacterized protein LOC132739093 n=1 Tax=Ruditapes philippinarum TaxID=129788 RepID=UPI00295B2E02|nr:uncharacterized protein LOC132739093 [Ruditapes philippinarum]
MIYVSTITLTSAIFSGTQKSLCIAIQGACVPLAGLFYPYLLDLLVSTYGLRGTFSVLSGVFCNSFAFSLMVWLHRSDLNLHTVKRNIGTEQEHQCDSETSTKGKLFTNLKNFIKDLMTKRFICLLVATAISVSTSNGFLDFVFDISHWKGFNNSEAKMSFVAYNICGVIFCVTPGLIKQISDIDTYFYPFGLAVIAFIGSITIWYASSFAVYTIGLACMSAVPGLLSSAFMICANLARLEQVSVAIGMFDTLIGFLSAGIGPIYGVIRDKTGHYNAVFLIFAVAQGIASLLFIGDIISRKLKLPVHKDIDGIDNRVNDEC